MTIRREAPDLDHCLQQDERLWYRQALEDLAAGRHLAVGCECVDYWGNAQGRHHGDVHDHRWERTGDSGSPNACLSLARKAAALEAYELEGE